VQPGQGGTAVKPGDAAEALEVVLCHEFG
jgi:hypothetical protein